MGFFDWIFHRPQCGNLAIFLPLIYVKFILTDFRMSINAILTILEALNFDFWKKCQKFPKIQNSELLKWSKW